MDVSEGRRVDPSHLHHDALHVVELLGVEERRELLSVRCQVPVLIGSLEPPFITGKHLFKAELVCGLVKVLRIGWNTHTGAFVREATGRVYEPTLKLNRLVQYE